MKSLKAKDLRTKTVEELLAMAEAERAALFAIRRDLVFRKTTDTTTKSVRRHNIARILGVIGEKERGTV